jgi:hypothetical protein
MAPAGATGFHGSHARVLVVDKDSHRGSCYGKHRAFRTIQAAVDRARRGDTILVCPGRYKETVKVQTERLTIRGANAGRDATKGGRYRESIVIGDPATAAQGAVQLLEDDIIWDGFKILDNMAGPGLYTSPGHSGYSIRNTVFKDNGIGVQLGSNGAHPTTVCRNRFIANNEFLGIGGGNGIYSNQGAQDVLITDNRFERHNGAAVLFADHEPGEPGEPGILQRNVRVEWNKSVDDRTFATFYASSRVRLTANVVRARVDDPQFITAVSAIFIGARNDDVVVRKNRVGSASGNGIDVTDSGEPGSTPSTPTNVVIKKNRVGHARIVGVHLALGTDDVLVTGNKALDNALDCQDESSGAATAGTNNTWQDNVGVTGDPEGICGPPLDDEPKQHGKGHHRNKHKKKKHRPDPCRCALPWRR